MTIKTACFYSLSVVFVLSLFLNVSFSQNCLPTYSCSLTAAAANSSFPCVAGGNITVNAANGTPPYTYVWSPNVSSTKQATNLAPGTYSITVIDNTMGAPGPELVVNGDFSAGNTGFSSSYAYCNTGLCLYPEAYYSVGTNPQFYHNQFWGNGHTTGTDNFMIINGDDFLSGVIWTETVTVTPNTDYVFSVWLSTMNQYPGITIQFSINGNTIGSPFAAPSQINKWDQFCAVWNSGSNTTAVISILNQSLINVGNDCGLDDISFRGTTKCSTTVVKTITQQPGILSTVSSVNLTCNGTNNGSASVATSAGTAPFTYSWNTTPAQASPSVSNLSAGNYSVLITDANGCTSVQSVAISEPPAMSTSVSATPASCGLKDGTANASAAGGSAPFTYLWLTSPLQSSPSISNLGQGTYNVIVADANGCSKQQSVTVAASGSHPVSAFAASTYTLDILDPNVSLTNHSSGATSWIWYFGDGDTSTLENPSHTYAHTGQYCVSLVVTAGDGTCVDSTVRCLEVLTEFSFYIPNTFTPTGDFVNEMFFGKGRGIKDYDIWLFDRWGNMIWSCSYAGESSDWDQPGQDGMPSVCQWDGKVVGGGVDMNGNSRKLAQEDVYVWKVRLTDVFNKEHRYIGHVNVVK